MNAQPLAQSAPAHGAARLAQIGAVALQLGLVILVLFRFRLETPGLRYLTVLALGGFLVHSFLPLAWRMRFFAGLSLAGVFLVLGPVNALWLFALGGSLIAICHLPVSFRLRRIILVAAGIGLGALLWFKIETPWPSVVWPVLASMFMFRMIVYIHDLQNSGLTAKPSSTIAYFFLLPNVCFPLFPVVDYEDFRNSHYNGEAAEIYQRGIRWIVRGMIHLILYRAVYYYLVIDPNSVESKADMLRYMISSFLLYLRVSGQFHLIVGMLLLFGFNLPRTNNLYFFASSFTDFWRRINIYWKDFMMKVFFYPAHFRLRKLGKIPAMMLATTIVFVITWLLHAYQWFWLGGSLLLALHDILFWTILAALVLVNAYYEVKVGRKRSLRPGRWTLPAKISVALRVAATFVTLCTLWSMWSSDSFEQWLGLWSTTGNLWLLLIAAVAALHLAALAVDRLEGKTREYKPSAASFWRQSALSMATLAALLVASVPAVYSSFSEEVMTVATSMRQSKLNNKDLATLERGYYEQLTSVNQHNASLMALYDKRPFSWKRIQETEAWQPTDDLLNGKLRANTSIEFKKAQLVINSFGMRDQEYSQEKPAGTFRIALLGSSHVMGSGVNNNETFEALLENQLNDDNDGSRYSQLEILNFAEASRNVVHQLYLLERKVAAFQPDAVFLVGHPQDKTILARDLTQIAMSGAEIPWTTLRDTFAEADLADQTAAAVERRLKPHLDDILAWAYRSIAEETRRQGAHLYWVLLPMIYEQEGTWEPASRFRTLEELGYTILDLTGVYDGHDADQLRIATWDNHPNVRAHQLISGSLYEQLGAQADFPPAEPATSPQTP